MLYAIAVSMIVLWLLVVPTPLTEGGMIHVLPVIALVAIVFRLMRRQNVWATTGPHAMEGKGIVSPRGQSIRQQSKRPYERAPVFFRRSN